MQINLTQPELEKFITDQVKAGYYKSADEVVEASLAKMMLHDYDVPPLDEATLDAIDQGQDDIEHGRYRSWDEVVADIRKKILKK